MELGRGGPVRDTVDNLTQQAHAGNSDGVST
jgi:hypothetical protein